MSLINSIEEFFWSIAIKKGVVTGLQALAGVLAVKAGLLQKFGVTIDLSTFQTASLVGITGLLEVFRNWLKQKYGLNFI